MKRSAEIGIVGGGIIGLTAAYELAERGRRDIIVLTASFPGDGSTFRCASGIRASFTTREHIVLMRESIRKWIEWTRGELGGYGLEFKQTGYLWLASREETVKRYEESIRLQNKLGVPTRLVDPEEARRIVPLLDTTHLKAALHDPTAGKASPFKAVHALVTYLRRHGIPLHTYTYVEKIVEGENGYTLYTSRGEYRFEKIIVAAGSGSPRLLAQLGVETKIENIPRHAMLTEHYKPVIDPLVVDPDTPGAPYIIQTGHGGFYIGRKMPETPGTDPYSLKITYMPLAIKPLLKWFPWLVNVRVLRHWMGYYVTTPDHHPIIGPVPGHEGLYVSTGYSGHGYMLCPAAATIIADYIIDGKPRWPEAYRLNIVRIWRGDYIHETAIIG